MNRFESVSILRELTMFARLKGLYMFNSRCKMVQKMVKNRIRNLEYLTFVLSKEKYSLTNTL